MASCGGDLERATTSLLPADVREIRRRLQLAVRPCGRDRVGLELTPEIRDRIGEVPEADRLDAGERSLGRRVRRAQDAFEPHAACALGDGEDAADAPQPAVERELTDGGVPVELGVRKLPRRGEHGERDGQVVAGALLAQPRRREVDGDPSAWKLELGRADPGAHSLPRLRAGAVGKTDDDERRRPVPYVGLDFDTSRLEADERMRDCACEHASTLRRRT